MLSEISQAVRDKYHRILPLNGTCILYFVIYCIYWIPVFSSKICYFFRILSYFLGIRSVGFLGSLQKSRNTPENNPKTPRPISRAEDPGMMKFNFLIGVKTMISSFRL